MRKRVSLFDQTEAPVSWWRAFLAGALGVSFMMALVDIFHMMGITPFSFEVYIGSLFTMNAYGPHSWTVGLFANWIIGGVFGLFYAYGFEFITHRSSVHLGALMGFVHAIVAALMFFPIFGAIHSFLKIELYEDFGFFGSGLGAPTPIILLMAHLIFGITAGLIYGPVRERRVRSREYEPGEVAMPGESDAITSREDAMDRREVYRT